ncbi:succinylglutamate desuccinylase/aspartoacylase family protein [Rhodobacter sp. SY28-1]|uniref:succinylglutamate desuccinylase/aspartoacylase family protein n=1 Tax=Rhodobacter sp. SY28-1 TaxID=2562317 RepID=UPI0010BF6E55|nr:succinylglutamate desuccinylase/aspartoacylase family protein [Rhodobacter sp. SY28-1]
MRVESVPLSGPSPGTTRTLTRYHWGREGARPKVYLQGGLHADEMPGPLTLFHLMNLLDQAEAEGRVAGHVIVVPLANPIGLSEWLLHKPVGRRDLEGANNFNRGYPDLAALAGDALEGKLGPDPAANARIIRAAFAQALAEAKIETEVDELRIRLMEVSHDADIVLDLHCDHRAVMHFYASTARPDITDLLGRCTGSTLALIEDVSGGNAFDEAHTAPWRALRDRYGDAVPQPCFSTTLEYRGQLDVDDTTAAQDAEGLMAFLAAVGALTDGPAPAHGPAEELPLAGAVEYMAPIGGIVSWVTQPGDRVTEGQVLGHVTDAASRQRVEITAPTTGLLFRQELWTSCLKGQGLCHVAGKEIRRQGNLLSN